jgi:hypothetical protein
MKALPVIFGVLFHRAVLVLVTLNEANLVHAKSRADKVCPDLPGAAVTFTFEDMPVAPSATNDLVSFDTVFGPAVYSSPPPPRLYCLSIKGVTVTSALGSLMAVHQDLRLLRSSTILPPAAAL